MPLTLSRDRLRFIRQHPKQTYAGLVLRSESYKLRSLYQPSLEYLAHDEDGNALGRQRQAIYDVEVGERRRAYVTVLAADDVDVVSETDEAWGRALTREDASGCGYQTVAALRASWKARHRLDLARVVWFAWGDWRDIDIFLQSTGSAGGDYTQNRHRALDPDAPALRPEEYATLSAANGQKDTARRAALATDLGAESDAARLARIEAAAGRMRLNIHRELGVIGDRIDRINRLREAA